MYWNYKLRWAHVFHFKQPVLHLNAFFCAMQRIWLNFPHFPLLHMQFSPSSWMHTRPNNNTDTGPLSAVGTPPTRSGAAIDTAVATSVLTGNCRLVWYYSAVIALLPTDAERRSKTITWISSQSRRNGKHFKDLNHLFLLLIDQIPN